MRCFLPVILLVVLGVTPSVGQDADPIGTSQQVVVKLFGAGVGTLDSYGSGVLVSAEGHVITVWNHLVNTGYLTAVVADGRRFDVEVIGTSAPHDVAVLKLTTDREEVFPYLSMSAGADVRPGAAIHVFSNMFHVATGNEPVSVVHGVVSGKAVLNAGLGRWQLPLKSPVYVIDAITNNSGAGGGLLTGFDGQPLGLVGREVRHRETGMWVNYAVPWTTLRPVVSAILDGRHINARPDEEDDTRPVSDVRLTVDFGLTLLPGILARTPAYIDRVIPNSPAAEAGLQRGDLVLLVNGRVIRTTVELAQALAKFRRGQTVTVTVSRDEQLHSGLLRIP